MRLVGEGGRRSAKPKALITPLSRWPAADEPTSKLTLNQKHPDQLSPEAKSEPQDHPNGSYINTTPCGNMVQALAQLPQSARVARTPIGGCERGEGFDNPPKPDYQLWRGIDRYRTRVSP